MSQAQICVSVTGQTIEKFLENLENIQKEVDVVELRVDYIENLIPENLIKIRQSLQKPAIFTCRMQRNGGKFENDTEKWKLFLEKAVELEFDYIDVELTECMSQKEYFKNLILPKTEKKKSKNHKKDKIPETERKTKFITSYHHYSDTPAYLQLRKIKKQMGSFNPDVYKFATTIKDQKDNQILAKLLLNKKSSEKMIVIGMGKIGEITRIMFPIFGSFLTFAAYQNTQTASGQIELDKLKQILNQLSEQTI